VIEFDAVYYDGKTSARKAVRVRGLSHSLHISGAEVNQEVPLAEVSVDAPLPGAARALRLPDGAQLQTGDHAAIEALFPRAHKLERWVHSLEKRWPYALTGLAVVALFSAWVVMYGIPLAASLAAEWVPPELEATLGEQALSAIDRPLCQASKLDAARQQALRERFAALTAGLDDGFAYRLELRDCRFGANALALPGGVVLMTDALAKLAQNDDQVSAVLAHEIGHVRHRHGLRLGLQAAGVAALSAAVLGDAVSISSLALSLPTVLLQTSYSREFETEADDYAFRRLKQVGISPRAFAEMIARLERSHLERGKSENRGKAVESLDYLSTHPATAKRIERALEAAGP
jgi:Zn-dependent protease with chaperone function